jgi:hypothetical protein
MSNELRTKSFRHGPYLVRYFRDSNGEFIVVIESNGVSVPGRYTLFNIDKDAQELTENAKNGGIDVSVDVAREILLKVSQGYGVEVVEGVEARGVGCQSLGFITRGMREYELIRCPDGVRLSDGDREVTVYIGSFDIGRVRDKHLKVEFVTYRNSHNQVFVTNDVGEFIEWFARRDEGVTEARLGADLARALLRSARAEEGYVYEGFYPDGYRRGVLPYPVVNPQCMPELLVEFAKWVREGYGLNRHYVLANVAFTLAKLYTPAIRMIGRVFEDRVVINTGRKRLGKTTSQLSIINLLGLDRNQVRVLGDNSIKTQERLRNLLNITIAPLFIDELLGKGFEIISGLILASTTEVGIIGLHASRVGIDFSNVFYSLRGVVVNTNLPFGSIINILGRENIDAYSRRVLILRWHDEVAGVREPFQGGGNIFQCMVELWGDEAVRREVLGSRDVFEVAMRVVKYFGIKYGVDTTDYQEALFNVYREFVEEEGEYVETAEEEALRTAMDIARGRLGMTNLTPARLINAIIDNPRVFDVYLARARYSDRVVEELRRLEALMVGLGFNIGDIEGDAPLSDELALLLRRLYQLINRDGYWAFLILPNSRNGMLRGHPHTFLGRAHQILDSETAKALGRKYAYKVPITEFTTYILGRKEIIEGGDESTESEN